MNAPEITLERVYVTAEPYAWPYDGDLTPANTALIVIDMQIDFCGKGGYVDSMGYDLALTQAPIEPIRKLLLALRRRGFLVIHTREGHRLDLTDLPANKRWRLSNVHLGARDTATPPSGDGFVMLGKTFKGMTDEMLRWQTAEFLAREIDRDGHIIYVRPELVAEVAFNDVLRSPHYPGGLALRHARIIEYRQDKTAAEADTIDAVRAIAVADGVI